MSHSPDNFWASNYYEHPPLTDEMVIYAEEQLGVKLPPAYMNALAGIVVDRTHHTAQNLLDTAYITDEWGLPPRQVLLSGDGHWWITLDYRNADEPTVAWIDVECGEDVQVAPSFAEFLAGLRPESEFDVGESA